MATFTNKSKPANATLTNSEKTGLTATFLLLETGDVLLKEDGAKIALTLKTVFTELTKLAAATFTNMAKP